jgi:sulfur carrier protein ThiS
VSGTVRVTLAPALVALFPGARGDLDAPPGTIAQIIDHLDTLWPGMADRICDERPAIRKHIAVFVDGARANLETPVRSGARVFILTAISGG